MKLQASQIVGAWIIDIEEILDARGFFARSFCVNDLRGFGLECNVSQQSVSYSDHMATLRGMHYQVAPHEEVKIVRVTRGRIWDVILDLRPSSPTYLKWEAFDLSALNHRALYIPKGIAHGFQTMENQTEVFYQMMQPYQPTHSRGVRWNDPAFDIKWPFLNPILSERDATYSDYCTKGK